MGFLLAVDHGTGQGRGRGGGQEDPQDQVAGIAGAGLGAGLGMGIATSKAVEAVGRQPEAQGKINSVLLLGLVLAESTAIYGFVVALLIMFVLGGKA